MEQRTLEQLSQDYERVEKALAFIAACKGDQPSLSRIARAVGLSEFHFQRLFSRWVGISPKRFLQFLTKEHAKSLLKKSRNILDVTYDAGLSSPGRLHDLFISCEAMSPGAYKRKGQGLEIGYGFSPSPFGPCMIAFTRRGITNMNFVQSKTRTELAAWLAGQWPRADLYRDDRGCRELAGKVFPFDLPRKPVPLHLFVQGTNFQIKVWEALARIPLGHTVSYQDIAAHIGVPGASRAVGTAVGKNPISFLLPCHRVIQKVGRFGNYGGGKSRKRAILGWEFALASDTFSPQ